MLIRIIKPRNPFKSFLVYYTCNFTLFLDTKNLTLFGNKSLLRSIRESRKCGSASTYICIHMSINRIEVVISYATSCPPFCLSISNCIMTYKR